MKVKRLVVIGAILLALAAASAAIAVPAFAGGPAQDDGSPPNRSTCAPRQGGVPSPLRGLRQHMGGNPNVRCGFAWMARCFKPHHLPRKGALIKIESVGESEFQGWTFNGDPVTVNVDDETVYVNPLEDEASLSDLTEGTIVRVRGAREDGTVNARWVFIVPENMHRLPCRGVVDEVSEEALTVTCCNGRTVEYLLSPSVKVRFVCGGEGPILPGDRVWVMGWKPDFSSEPPIAVRVLDFGQNTDQEDQTP